MDMRELILSMFDFLNIAKKWTECNDPDTFYRFMDKLYYKNRNFLTTFIRNKEEVFSAEQKAIIAAYYCSKNKQAPITATKLPYEIDVSYGTSLDKATFKKYNVWIPA